MADGTIDRSGNVTIRFNLQAERLWAGDGRQLLPCEWCGTVQLVAGSVVSFICSGCSHCHCGAFDVEIIQVDRGRAMERDVLICNACGHESNRPGHA